MGTVGTHLASMSPAVMLFDNHQNQQLDMFGYLNFDTGNFPIKALDSETTHVAVNKVNRDSHIGNIQQATPSGEKQVYKTANTNVPNRSGGTKHNMGDNRAKYFTSSLHGYRDGQRSELIQTCGEITMDCGRWCRDGKIGGKSVSTTSGGNGISTVSRDNGVSTVSRGNGVSTISGGRTGTFLHSYRAESGQNMGDGYFTDKLETHFSRGCKGGVRNRTRKCGIPWVYTEGLQTNWGVSCTKNVQKSKGDSCTAILQNRREDRCTTNSGGESRAIGVHNSGADSRATRVQNNSTDSCTAQKEIKKTESYLCTVIERCTSNVKYNEGCNTVIKLISARKCTIRGQDNKEICKNYSLVINYSGSKNSHNLSTVNCTSVIETNGAANCANMTGNLNSDCVTSANNHNAEKSPFNQHKPGTSNDTTTAMHTERIDTSKSCKQNPDCKSKLGSKEFFISEHTEKPSLNSQATIRKHTTHTSGVEQAIRRSTETSGVEEGTRSISICRRDTSSSGMCTYTTKKGLIAPPRFSCPQEKSPSDPLAINERSKIPGAQSMQPMSRFNYTESATASSYSRYHRHQSPSAPLAVNESSNSKDIQIIPPSQAACGGNTDQSLAASPDIEMHSSRGNCSSNVLLGVHETSVSEGKPQVCSQSTNAGKQRLCQYYNTLANRPIGNLIGPLSNLAIAEIPSSYRRTKLNRDIWPTETKNRTWSNGMRDGNRQQVVSKFRTAHESSHQTTNKEMASKHSRNSGSHSHSATSGVTQQQRSTRLKKSYLFKRNDIPDKSSKYTIPNRHNFRKVPRIRQQNSSAAPLETMGQTSSCPIIQINSLPADRSPLGFILGMADADTPTTEADTLTTDADTPATNTANFPTSRSGGFLSVPGPQVYFDFERHPNLSDQ